LRQLLPAATFFDADHAARELAETDPEARTEIAAAFGPEIYSREGHLNRAALRAIVFADPEKKRALEQILHPRIRRQWSVAAESRRQSTELFFADIPLLYETGGETLCDCVVVVACSRIVQLQRLMARSSLSEIAAQQIIAAQWPLAEKLARADYVVWNNGPRDMLAAQTETLVRLWQQNG
ncbi:MAG: dephospho-CoA kinase, partial [Chthoniobacterales bacterium]